MTMPPPPPDRMHLQYQPAPPPPPAPQQMGPGGAYGPAQYAPEQPVPGQMPMGMMMGKPGTITGIQVILYFFLAVSTVGNVLSIMSMVEFFNPFSLIGLAFAVYSAIQSLTSGVQIARGKRWAWIWSLVSAILGLALACAGIVYGTIFWDTGGDLMLLVTCPLAALYLTLLILLCTKSARQWILMHRMQRGEVQMSGMGGAPGMGGMAPQGQGAPQRPDTKPGAVAFTIGVLVLMMALCAWSLFASIRSLLILSGQFAMDITDAALLYGVRAPLLGIITASLLLICALISAIGLHRGKSGARVHTLVWTPILFLAVAFGMATAGRDYFYYVDTLPPPVRTNWTIVLVRELALAVLVLVVFIAVLTPGVRAWTPGKPSLVMVVPMGQPQGGYPQQPQQGYPQQQPPYPPQY